MHTGISKQTQAHFKPFLMCMYVKCTIKSQDYALREVVTGYFSKSPKIQVIPHLNRKKIRTR